MKPGQVVMGRYVIEALAGAGGMGSVYRARDGDGGVVAIKVLRSDKTHLAGRFVREARVLRELVHPAIVRCVDAGVTDEGERVLVMEWLEGADLQARLDGGPLSLEDTLALAGRVAGALGVAHGRGMVHRDVKPGNIVLPGGDVHQAKLVDFGVVRWAEATTLTATGMQIGTPRYMAPEQIRGERNIDGRADVFALGCVLYECLTGEPAFSGHSPMAVFYKILVEDIPQIGRVIAGVPEPLVKLLERMLAKQPDARPADGAEIAVEIAYVQEMLANAHGLSLSRVATAEVITGTEQHLVSVVVMGKGSEPRQGDADERQNEERAEYLLSTVETGADGMNETMPEHATMRHRPGFLVGASSMKRWAYDSSTWPTVR